MPVFQDDSWFVWNHVLRKYCQLRINAVCNILCEFVASTCLLQLICQFCNLSPWRRKVQTSLVSNISVQESRQFSYKVRTFLCISISFKIGGLCKSKICPLNRQTQGGVFWCSRCRFTLRFFFKFFSQANYSNSYPPIKWLRKQKM